MQEHTKRWRTRLKGWVLWVPTIRQPSMLEMHFCARQGPPHIHTRVRLIKLRDH